MQNIFDLSKINQIIENNHPARILVLDTNVLMDEPDTSIWGVTQTGSTIFLLSDSVIHEMEYIRHRHDSREKTDSQDKADKAVKQLASLFKQGNITDGIAIKAGWIVGVPSPKQDDLDTELAQFDDIVKAFGRYDTKMLLLTRECGLSFERIPVFFVTKEFNLFNVAEMNGISCHLHKSFPIENLKIGRKLLNWDKVLNDIQDKIKETSFEVEATMTVQRTAPEWLSEGQEQIIVEGQGVVKDGTKNFPFLWTICFSPGNFTTSLNPPKQGTSDLPWIHLDFLGYDDFEKNLYDSIVDRLLDSTSPNFEEHTPILQTTKSLNEVLLYYELSKNIKSKKELKKICDFVEKTGDPEAGWLELIAGTDLDYFQVVKVFLHVTETFDRCWSIGEPYHFRVVV
jgi:PIN domain